MYKSFRFISILGLIVTSLGTIFASEIPYTDVAPSAPYASAVQELYDGRVIRDDWSHLFRPTDLMARDFFVSLAVGIGCHECITPSIDDIIHYNISPFVDLSKVNPYYYCIAYAKEYNIAQGYIPDTTGVATCEDWHPYSSSPFCAGNTISRIEAAAILLRRAHLWDDGLNSGNFDRSLSIPDTTIYWYGYAKKAIEIEIITPQSDGKIGQDEKITRGEFAIMAARILRYTQCQTIKKDYSVPSEIIIKDPNGKTIVKSVFPKWYTGSLAIDTGSGSISTDWDKRWTLRNPTTGESYTGSGDSYPISWLGCGTWINTVDLLDRTTGQVVSSASNTITIECSEQKSNPPLSVAISADPLRLHPGDTTQFWSVVTGGSGSLSYHWDFGDGSISSSSTSPSHTYGENGTYTVTLTVTDASGHTAISSVVIVVSGDKDTDGDGIKDPQDKCPLVYAKTVTGCPSIDTYTNQIDNLCLAKKQKEQWLLIGAPNCTQCPCSNTIQISSLMRSCDTVFPTILSPSLDAVYARGKFFIIP
jgi:PKD repeat protein